MSLPPAMRGGNCPGGYIAQMKRAPGPRRGRETTDAAGAVGDSRPRVRRWQTWQPPRRQLPPLPPPERQAPGRSGRSDGNGDPHRRPSGHHRHSFGRCRPKSRSYRPLPYHGRPTSRPRPPGQQPLPRRQQQQQRGPTWRRMKGERLSRLLQRMRRAVEATHSVGGGRCRLRGQPSRTGDGGTTIPSPSFSHRFCSLHSRWLRSRNPLPRLAHGSLLRCRCSHPGSPRSA